MASDSSAGTDLNKRIEAARAKIQAKLAGGASESESVTPSVGAKKKIVLSRSTSQKAAEQPMKKSTSTSSPAGTAKSVESEADRALDCVMKNWKKQWRKRRQGKKRGSRRRREKGRREKKKRKEEKRRKRSEEKRKKLSAKRAKRLSARRAKKKRGKEKKKRGKEKKKRG